MASVTTLDRYQTNKYTSLEAIDIQPLNKPTLRLSLGCRHCITCFINNASSASQHQNPFNTSNMPCPSKEWWPAGLRSPTAYISLRRNQLEYQIRSGSTSTLRYWRKAGDRLSTQGLGAPSALRSQRHLPQLSVLIPATYTNITPTNTNNVAIANGGEGAAALPSAIQHIGIVSLKLAPNNNKHQQHAPLSPLLFVNTNFQHQQHSFLSSSSSSSSSSPSPPSSSLVRTLSGSRRSRASMLTDDHCDYQEEDEIPIGYIDNIKNRNGGGRVVVPMCIDINQSKRYRPINNNNNNNNNNNKVGPSSVAVLSSPALHPMTSPSHNAPPFGQQQSYHCQHNHHHQQQFFLDPPALFPGKVIPTQTHHHHPLAFPHSTYHQRSISNNSTDSIGTSKSSGSIPPQMNIPTPLDPMSSCGSGSGSDSGLPNSRVDNGNSNNSGLLPLTTITTLVTPLLAPNQGNFADPELYRRNSEKQARRKGERAYAVKVVVEQPPVSEAEKIKRNGDGMMTEMDHEQQQQQKQKQKEAEAPTWTVLKSLAEAITLKNIF